MGWRGRRRAAGGSSAGAGPAKGREDAGRVEEPGQGLGREGTQQRGMW